MRRDGFKDFVLDQLQGIGEVRCRAMFGGYGLYRRTVFFGIIHKGRLYFNTNASTRPAYIDRGMQPFRPRSRQTLTAYYEVPIEIVENAEDLTIWAETAAESHEQDMGHVRRRHSPIPAS